MDNEITINIEDIKNAPDNSITDPETIRQIALWGIKNNSNELYCKINKEFEFFGLYPEVRQITILDGLKKYFAKTPQEQIEKDWAELEEYDEIRPTIGEFLKEMKKNI